MVPPSARHLPAARTPTETARRRPRAHRTDPSDRRAAGHPARRAPRWRSRRGSRTAAARQASGRAEPGAVSASNDQKSRSCGHPESPAGRVLSQTRRRAPASRAPTPSTVLRYRSKCPPRFVAKSTRGAVRGDQTVRSSSPGSRVRRLGRLRVRESNTQRIAGVERRVEHADDHATPVGRELDVAVPRPDRRARPVGVQRDRTRPAASRYRRADRPGCRWNENAERRRPRIRPNATCSATGRGSPLTVKASASNGCASRRLSRTNSRCPSAYLSPASRGPRAGVARPRRGSRRGARAARSPRALAAPRRRRENDGHRQAERVAVQQIPGRFVEHRDRGRRAAGGRYPVNRRIGRRGEENYVVAVPAAGGVERRRRQRHRRPAGQAHRLELPHREERDRVRVGRPERGGRAVGAPYGRGGQRVEGAHPQRLVPARVDGGERHAAARPVTAPPGRRRQSFAPRETADPAAAAPRSAPRARRSDLPR